MYVPHLDILSILGQECMFNVGRKDLGAAQHVPELSLLYLSRLIICILEIIIELDTGYSV